SEAIRGTIPLYGKRDGHPSQVDPQACDAVPDRSCPHAITGSIRVIHEDLPSAAGHELRGTGPGRPVRIADQRIIGLASSQIERALLEERTDVANRVEPMKTLACVERRISSP